MCTKVYEGVLWCRVAGVSRTNIELDDELVERAMRLLNLRTKREVVQLALERLVGSRAMTPAEQLAMQGRGWEGDLEPMRREFERFPEWDAGAAR
jgi:Arc/MetJ family transcription regulator